MKDILTRYKVTLTARGPVFVGSGTEINKKEYIMLPSKKVIIMDMAKLYGLAQRQGKTKDFEVYMLNPQGSLEGWLKEEKLYEAAQEDCVRYALDMGDTQLTRGRRPQLMACMKDVYGKPYIPGSTLKGMLRGILATARLLQDERLRGRMRNNLQEHLGDRAKRTHYLARTTRRMEQELFCTLKREPTKWADAVNDELSGLIVSDSEPLEPERLVLAQKVERRVDGEERTLNLLRESLRPGTEICFHLTIDSSRCHETEKSILAAIEIFDEAYNKNFLQVFSGMGRLRPWQVFVGGGSGFVGKTLVYPLLGKQTGLDAAVQIFEHTGVPPSHKHKEDKRMGASPHILKCSWYAGRTLQMGLCDFAMERQEL